MPSTTAHENEDRLINVAITRPLHRQAKAAAALSGLSLQDFVQRSIQAAIPSELGHGSQIRRNGTEAPVEQGS